MLHVDDGDDKGEQRRNSQVDDCFYYYYCRSVSSFLSLNAEKRGERRERKKASGQWSLHVVVTQLCLFWFVIWPMWRFRARKSGKQACSRWGGQMENASVRANWNRYASDFGAYVAVCHERESLETGWIPLVSPAKYLLMMVRLVAAATAEPWLLSHFSLTHFGYRTWACVQCRLVFVLFPQCSGSTDGSRPVVNNNNISSHTITNATSPSVSARCPLLNTKSKY